jgi:hypothetical protein
MASLAICFGVDFLVPLLADSAFAAPRRVETMLSLFTMDDQLITLNTSRSTLTDFSEVRRFMFLFGRWYRYQSEGDHRRIMDNVCSQYAW